MTSAKVVKSVLIFGVITLSHTLSIFASEEFNHYIQNCVHGTKSRHTTDCTKYVTCWKGHRIDLSCSTGTVFNEQTKECDDSKNVPRCLGQNTLTSSTTTKNLATTASTTTPSATTTTTMFSPVNPTSASMSAKSTTKFKKITTSPATTKTASFRNEQDGIDSSTSNSEITTGQNSNSRNSSRVTPSNTTEPGDTSTRHTGGYTTRKSSTRQPLNTQSKGKHVLELCPCACPVYLTSPNSTFFKRIQQWKKKETQLAEQIRKEMFINGSALKSARYKKISALDGRPSSNVLGSFAIILCCLPVLAMFVLDLFTLCKCNKNKVVNSTKVKPRI